VPTDNRRPNPTMSHLSCTEGNQTCWDSVYFPSAKKEKHSWVSAQVQVSQSPPPH
jgi:hypothetical protein